jgi:molecular chaperone DnaJ
MGDEYYERLGVSADASAEEIAAAYRERLKETHPDVSDASDAGERTKRLIEAKEVLTDETERARYDRLGHDQYVSAGPNGTAASGASARADESDTGDGQSDPDTADATGGGTTGEQTGDHSRGGRTGRRRPGHNSGARSARGVDWGTHSTGGVDWDEWSDTDWEEVSEAVWQEVTGADASTRSRHTAADWESATDRDTATTSAGGTGSTDTADWSSRTGSAGHGGASSTAADATAGHTATADGAGGTSSGASGARRHSPPDGATTATRDSARVGWYSGGDPSGTSHDAWSFGGTRDTGESWRSWTPGTDRDSRHGQGSFPPHRILSPVQTVVLFCLCFVTYPLLVGSAVFPLFSSPVRIVFAVFLVFVMALLIVLPQLGVLVFGGWTVLFPLAFANLGVALFAPESLLTMGAVLFSLGLSGFSWLLSRPPVL